VETGAVAHGGHVVARAAGQVVFVRHALPGERVSVRVTEGGRDDRFLRADAVAVLRASPDRVEPPCPWAGPELCGGCDFQHVSLVAQRRLKSQVVEELLRRLAGLDLRVEVEPVPGDDDGLRWRTRMQYHRAPDGSLGLLRHRSHTVVPVDDCRIAHPAARTLEAGETASRGAVTEHVLGHAFTVATDGFWQVHPGAPQVLVEAVLSALDAQPGESALDLYAGVGLFSAFLAERVGRHGSVVSVESDPTASGHARSNLASRPWATTLHDRVDRALAGALTGVSPDLVVLDPPREGARRGVVEAVAALGARAVAYVACDPAALARDLACFAENGYALRTLRAFDCFPMTHHLECVAGLARTHPST
jgi:tRNA/tmRNA/rRNA uracil-C5-methylase (TrmA/RlmC/RlmD family)